MNAVVLDLRVGDLVEVRSAPEIQATLDENGALEGLPFMPEMLRYCGQRLKVGKRADKTCDTISVPTTGLRRMTNAVHLEGVRCDGTAHGGCQAACLVFWKEAWLKRVPPNGILGARSMECASVPPGTAPAPADQIYSCQATELFRATSRLASWDVRQYVRDIKSGNASLRELAQALLRSAFRWNLQHLRGYRASIRAYNLIQRYRGGTDWPDMRGALDRTPSRVLDLRPGDVVRVKSRDAIVRTLDTNNKNRGLSWDFEMVRYCGGTFRVLRRVEKIIDERTGKMMKLPNDCIILDGVTCTAQFHKCCPRGIYPYWREIWLERVGDGEPAPSPSS